MFWRGGSDLALHMNEELVPMNRMHGENTVSLEGMCVGVGDVDWRGVVCEGE